MLGQLFTRRANADVEGALRVLEGKCEQLRRELAELSTKVSTTAGAALTVRINELEAVIDQLQRSNRKELGRLWKMLGDDRSSSSGSPLRNGVHDPDLEAMIALQSAPPPKPG